MDYRESIYNLYLAYSGSQSAEMEALPLSGSDRRYYRIVDAGRKTIGAYNPGFDENEAFIGFTYHFRSLGLPVPEIYKYFAGSGIYFMQDFGDINLFSWLHSNRKGLENRKVEAMYRKILGKLVLFQTEGIKGLDLDLCYPHKSFDRQSMMWDMNYFKYMFLKLIAAPFNENKLEKDFNTLADFLLEPGQDYFLYRDFQSANIMIVNEEPWFIDYQGGRGGAPMYDAASLLYDSKALLSSVLRESLIEWYIKKFSEITGKESSWFRMFYPAFCLLRIMQAMGAYGLRGLVEKKPGFAESIVPAVNDICSLVPALEKQLKLPELFSVIESLKGLPAYRELIKKT